METKRRRVWAIICVYEYEEDALYDGIFKKDWVTVKKYVKRITLTGKEREVRYAHTKSMVGL